MKVKIFLMPKESILLKLFKSLFSILSGISHNSVLVLLSFLFNSIHSNTDKTLHSSFQPLRLSSSNKLKDIHRIMHVTLSKESEFKGSESYSKLSKRSQLCYLKKSLTITIKSLILQNSEPFNLVCISFEKDLSWHKHITYIATSAAKKN